jgi:hypothetical protein
MLVEPQPPRIHVPKGWQGCVKSAVLCAISLFHWGRKYLPIVDLGRTA